MILLISREVPIAKHSQKHPGRKGYPLMWQNKDKKDGFFEACSVLNTDLKLLNL